MECIENVCGVLYAMGRPTTTRGLFTERSVDSLDGIFCYKDAEGASEKDLHPSKLARLL